MKKNQIKCKNTFSLILLLIFCLFSVATSAKEKTSIQQEIVKTWYFLPIKPGKIPDHKIKAESSIKFIFRTNGTYNYINSNKDFVQQGTWKYIDSNFKLQLIDNSGSNIKEFTIVKCTNKELIITTNDNAFVYRSEIRQKFALSSLRAVSGIIILIFLVFLFSKNRKKINWYIPAVGLLLQLVMAVLILKIGFIRTGFGYVSSFFVHLLQFTDEGARFVFGSLVDKPDQFGIIFAFKILPTVIFFSAFTSLLYYFGILQKIVWVFAWLMSRIMKLSGAESLAAAANVFVGQTEAPLVIKPYLSRMSESEIMALMTGGMATIAGGVMAAYISFLGGTDPAQQQMFATHLLTASIMNAPASLFLAKILVPETNSVDRDLKVSKEVIGSNFLDSLARGTTDGLKLAVNVGAMLLVFTALMALLNFIVFHWIGNPTGLNEMISENSNGQYKGLTLQYILGTAFAPVSWLIGIPSTDLILVGQLLGEKTVLNEFFAFTTFSTLKNSFLITDTKSIIIATYALCGFANFTSIGIQLGGIGALAPTQRVTLSRLAFRALLAGTVASLLSAAIIGMLI